VEEEGDGEADGGEEGFLAMDDEGVMADEALCGDEEIGVSPWK